MNLANLKRLYKIINTFLVYGLDEVLPHNGYTRPLRCWRKTLFWLRNKHKGLAFGVRLRLALQELGPVWIKLGQMLSTRRDLFPPEIADELALLQDQVDPFDGKLARAEIERALGGQLETWFDDFDENALASASIAQVHTAKFNASQPLAGQEVVLKVIRPNIQQVIDADLALMYRLAGWIPRLSTEGHRLRPEWCVNTKKPYGTKWICAVKWLTLYSYAPILKTARCYTFRKCIRTFAIKMSLLWNAFTAFRCLMLPPWNKTVRI